MKRTIFLITILMFTLTNTLASNKLFLVGEELIYTVKMLGLTVGEQKTVVISKLTLNEEEVFYINSITVSNNFLSKFYKLNDKIDTYLGTVDLLPRYIKKEIHEGKYNCYITASINQGSLTATVSRQKTVDDQVQPETYQLSRSTHDSVSVIYWLRNQHLNIGDVYNIDILGRELLPVTIKVVKEEEIKVPLGKFNTIKVEGKGYDIIVWFTKDSAHLPVKIALKTQGGYLQAFLKEIKNKCEDGICVVE